MIILKAYATIFLVSFTSIGTCLEVTSFSRSGVFASQTSATLTKPDNKERLDLLVSAKLILTRHKIWGLDDTDWKNVVVTSLEPGGESLSVLKVIDPTNNKSVVIKCYNPKLKDLGLRIGNVLSVANSDFIRQIRTSQDPNMPTIITASYLIEHQGQYFEIMPTAPGIELWGIFFHKYFPETPYHPTDEEYRQILEKFGLSLAAFHLAGASEERLQRLSNPHDCVVFFATTILSDANLGNFIYAPDTKSFTFIDTSQISLSLRDKRDSIDDLYMAYWHTFSSCTPELKGNRPDFNDLFMPVINGYCSHPHFSKTSSEALVSHLTRSILSGPKPKFLRDMEALSEQDQLEDQPGLWQLQV